MQNIVVSNLHINFFNVICRYSSIKDYIHHNSFNDIKDLLNTCLVNDAKILIPIYIADSYFLSKNKQIFIDNGLNFFVSSCEIIDTFNNKRKFHDFMVNNHLNQYVPKKYDDYIYPCILKNVCSDFGKDTYIINKYNDLPKFITDKTNIDNYIILEPIYGNREYATHIFAIDGEIKIHATVQYSRDKDLYISSGTDKPLNAYFINKISDEVFNVLVNIMKICSYTGVCCIDYKIVDNVPIIFEINPRFGGSLIHNEKLFCEFIKTYIKSVSYLE
jgi:carbamoylphosphate synthase large subunit